MADHARSLPEIPVRERDYARLAWWIIGAAFLVFCLLVAGSCYLGWRFKALAQSQPDQPATLKTFSRGVDIRRVGLVPFELPLPDTVLHEGDTVRVAPTIAPGVAATITLFDGSTIDLWPGTLVTLDQVQTTRFSSRNQRVALFVERGMVRLTLVERADRLYRDVVYTVATQQAGRPLEQATLELGGTYRVRVLEADSPNVSAIERTQLGAEIHTEYVVERGNLSLTWGKSAEVHPITGQKVVVTENGPQPPEIAAWPVIRDSDWSAYTDRQYNNTTEPISKTNLIRSDTWFVVGEPAAGTTRAEWDGFFHLYIGCLQRDAGNNCSQISNIAQFRRDTPLGHTKGFKTSITQTLALDITPYDTLNLTLDARIITQSLNRAGAFGVQCGLGVTVRYTNTENNPESHTFCFYARDDDDPSNQGVLPNQPYITAIKLPFGQWSTINLNLFEYITNMRRIDRIELYGDGHDYLTEIANVQMIAR